MRSSYDRTVLLSYLDNDNRQRRRRKERLHLTKSLPSRWLTPWVSSVWWWIYLHYFIHHHFSNGYVPARYRLMGHTSNCVSRDHIYVRDHDECIASDRFHLLQNQHHFATTSLQSKPFSDRNRDQNNSTKEDNTAADQILRNMGGLVPFFASPSAPTPEPKPDIITSKNIAFWGVGDWFRRGNNISQQNKTNVDPATSSSSKKKQQQKRDAKDIKKNPKVETTKRKPDVETTSPLAKLQDFFSFNFTTPSNKKVNTSEVNSTSTSNNNKNNPLSVVQKFFSTPFFQNNNQPVETWYTVFPKTRIMPGEMVPVSVTGIDLLVIASIDGRSLYCIANSCPHLGTPLETGRLTRLPMESTSLSTSGSSSSIKTTTDSTLTTITTTANEAATLNNKGGSSPNNENSESGIIFSETDIANILSQDGCEDCIICPLHRTAFALSSGEVRGEWCPYPPVIGALMGTVKEPTSAAVFQVRTRGKNIEVRLNSVLDT